MVELQLLKNQIMSARHWKPPPVMVSSHPLRLQSHQLQREPHPSYKAATYATPRRHQEDPATQLPVPRASTYTTGYAPQQRMYQYQPVAQPPPPKVICHSLCT